MGEQCPVDDNERLEDTPTTTPKVTFGAKRETRIAIVVAMMVVTGTTTRVTDETRGVCRVERALHLGGWNEFQMIT